MNVPESKANSSRRTSHPRYMSRVSLLVAVGALCVVVATVASGASKKSGSGKPKGKTSTTVKKRTAATTVSNPTPATDTARPVGGATPTSTASAAGSIPVARVGSCGPIKVMPLGDSLTAFAESYRGPLYRSLTGLGYSVDFVGSLDWAPVGGGDPDSEGHGGFTIGPDDRLDSEGRPGNISANIDAWLKRSTPEVVLLTIGTNDLAGGTAPAGQAPQKLRSLVLRMHAEYPDMTIIVGDVPPNIYNAKSASTNAVNETARSLGALSSTDTIVYAGTAASLLALGFDPASGTSDGTHFTTAGGELFAKAWLPAVRPVLDSRSC
jgi:lysophospholipase L1-like esterase